MFTFTIEIEGKEVPVIVPDFSGWLTEKESAKGEILHIKDAFQRHFEKKMKEGIDDE